MSERSYSTNPELSSRLSPNLKVSPQPHKSSRSFLFSSIAFVALGKMSKDSSEPLYIGIDVGTGSVRAALVAKSGGIIASATKDTQTFRDSKDHRIFEQSTTDIWNAICICVGQVLAPGSDGSRIDPARVKGVGFDATCSLAVSDTQGNPITVSKGEDLGKPGDRNVILWADHRAEEEAKLINSTGSVVLDYVGGVMSVSSINGIQ